MRRLVVAFAVGLVAAPAGAWESQCRDSWGNTAESSVCQQSPECAAGLAQARGAQQGEHTLLTELAMRWAGLGAFVDQAVDFEYYSNGFIFVVDQGGTATLVPSVEPAGTPRMLARVQRTVPIASFAQVPDGSYSLSDYLMGNEHCVVPFVDNRTLAQVQACHSYGKHLASVNSTHFAPQAKAAFRLYHGLALATAQRCRRMCGAFADGTCSAFVGQRHEARLLAAVRACEQEALAIEAVASHFAADAWSSGHMWQRWGSPNAASREQLVTANVVSLVSGLIHGWRGVVRGDLTMGRYQHDQLCMSGPVRDYPAGEDAQHPDEIVHWTYPFADAPHPAGGDLYLLDCEQRQWNDPRWAVAPQLLQNPAGRDRTDRPLSEQYRMMLSCMARGFDEVYREGPRTVPLKEEVLGAETRLDVVGWSEQRECWDQRVTNASMTLGAGITYLGGGFDELSFLGRLSVDALPAIAAQGGEPSTITEVQLLLDPHEPELRASLVRLAGDFAKVKHRTGAGGGPTGTALAQLDDFPEFLGVKRNQEGVADIERDGVPYLERHAASAADGEWRIDWGFAPGGECTTDANCVAAARQFCDRSNMDGAVVTARCVEHEVAIPRAFRTAELPYWCGRDTADELEEARRQCELVGGDACDGCRLAVLPHIRNSACGAAGYERLTINPDRTVSDNRAACDVLADLGLVTASLEASAVYASFGPYGDLASLADALCRGSDPLCVGPACARCPAGQLCCPDAACAGREGCPHACLDPTADTRNCGACGHACQGQQPCCHGTCASPRLPVAGDPTRHEEQSCCENQPDDICTRVFVTGRETVREAYCDNGSGRHKTNVEADPANCGACNIACGAGRTCCFGTCVNTDTDPSNCGGCGTECSPVNAFGQATCCNGQCLGPYQVAAHCAGCNTPCQPGEWCAPRAGCIPSAWTDWGNTCDPPGGAYPIECGFYCYSGNDAALCGSCGTSCSGGAQCCQQACVPPALYGTPCAESVGAACGLTCTFGRRCCDGACMDPAGGATPHGWCGDCWTYCRSGDQCCPSGCADLGFDDRNCGWCGNACATGTSCCYHECVDTAADPRHCGGCGQACAPGQQCCAGGCC